MIKKEMERSKFDKKLKIENDNLLKIENNFIKMCKTPKNSYNGELKIKISK
jgi:hypothetical protein